MIEVGKTRIFEKKRIFEKSKKNKLKTFSRSLRSPEEKMKMNKEEDLEKGKIVCSKRRFYWAIFAAFFALICLFVIFGLLMHKMVEDMIEEAIAENRIPSNSVKYQAAVTLPPITTMLVKGRLDPSLKIQATIEEPPLIEPESIRFVHQSDSREEDLDSFLEEDRFEDEKTADPVDYSIEYSSESYDESYEYAGSGDYSSSSSSSSSSLTDDESLHGADESYDAYY